MIQRGRGACVGAVGAQRAVAGDLVVDCIVHDPRWDDQVEQRSWLYATLVAELGVDVSRLRAAYAGPADPYGDSGAWLATGVLELLARRGVDGAVTELRHYLRSGRDLDQALAALIPFADHPEAEGLLDEVLEVADDEQLGSALKPFGRFSIVSSTPWPEWRRASARIERVAVAAEHAQSSRERPLFDHAARVATEHERLLRAAVESNLITASSRASLTGDRWEATLLDIATEVLQHDDRSVRNAARRSLRTLRSPRALAWARANAADGSIGYVAMDLITELAEPSDAPWMLDLLNEAVALGNSHINDQCTLVKALGRASDVAAVSTVEDIFDNTVYSYLRRQCADALSHLTPDFANERAIECLDDCESGTREIAIAHANILIPEVRERIGRIVEDPTEDDDNRRSASARITKRR